MTKVKNDDESKKGLLDKLAEREIEVARDVQVQSQKDIFSIDEYLSELTEVSEQKYLSIPAKVVERFKEKGVRLSWIRIKGEGGMDNLIRKEADGWRLLPASAVPEMSGSGLGVQKLDFMRQLNREDPNLEFIVRKDVALAANYESNVKKVKGASQAKADSMQQALRGKASGQGLEYGKETKMETKVGKNAMF